MLNYIKWCWASTKIAFIARTCEKGCNVDRQCREIALCSKHKSEFNTFKGLRTTSRSNHDQWKLVK